MKLGRTIFCREEYTLIANRPVVDFGDAIPQILDLTKGIQMDFPPDTITIGKYNERRKGLYEVCYSTIS